ncbi:MAG: ABC transporter substrate-binding protein [Eubacteriales bacterium]|nr:ABC transporter substrate-binding protein [Eubacteriales bacterium]
MLLLAALLLTGVSGAFAEGKTIVYWTMWESTEPQGKVLKEAAQAYEAETGNKVDLQFKGRTGMREGLQPALDAGTIIDIFDEDMDRVNVSWIDYILDIEDLAKAANYEETANAGLIGAARQVAGGTLKSIPYQPFVFAFFYNADIFEEAGVEAPPATWAELLDACEKIKNAGYVPITSDDAYIMTNLGYHMARLIGEEGVRRVVDNGEWAEEPAVLEAAKAYADLAAKGYLSPTIGSSVWPTNQNGEFAMGESAIYLNGSWLPNEVKEMTGPDYNWGCFSYPAVEGGVHGPEAANFGSQVLAINKSSQVAPEAFDLIVKITKGEFDAKLSIESVGIPVDSTNIEWPAMLASAKDVMNQLSVRYSWAAGIENNVNMTPYIKQAFQQLCGGQITPEQFVDTLETASN